MTRRTLLATLALTSWFLCSCAEEAPLERVAFRVFVHGAQGASNNTLAFRTARGWDVTLRTATLSVQAMYFRNAPPQVGTSAADEGRAVAQVLTAFTVNALDPRPTELAGGGNGITELARSAEFRLTEELDGPVPEAISRLAGTARRGAVTIEFEGSLTFPADRSRPAYQAVIDRRVQNLPVEFLPEEGGALSLRVDPSRWFDEIDFTVLPGETVRHFDDRQVRAQLRSGVAGDPNTFRVLFDAGN